MSKEQIQAIKCAYADLVGVLQAEEQEALNTIDTGAISLTVGELEDAFPDLELDN